MLRYRCKNCSELLEDENLSIDISNYKVEGELYKYTTDYEIVDECPRCRKSNSLEILCYIKTCMKAATCGTLITENISVLSCYTHKPETPLRISGTRECTYCGWKGDTSDVLVIQDPLITKNSWIVCPECRCTDTLKRVHPE